MRNRKLSPYGKAGDHLWVRETWLRTEKGNCYFRADITEDSELLSWKPSIHMPKKYSRILLEIVSTRIERVQDITNEDAEAEGIFFTDYGRECLHQGQRDITTCPAPAEHHPQKAGWMWKPTTSSDQCLHSPKNAFGNLWESINGKRPRCSWDDNPYVWVIEFKLAKQPF